VGLLLVGCASTRPAYYDGTEESIAWKARGHLECETGKLRIEEGANQVIVFGCGKRAVYTLLGPYRKAMLEDVEPSGEPPAGQQAETPPAQQP
jgi:hypothetical protein